MFFVDYDAAQLIDDVQVYRQVFGIYRGNYPRCGFTQKENFTSLSNLTSDFSLLKCTWQSNDLNGIRFILPICRRGSTCVKQIFERETGTDLLTTLPSAEKRRISRRQNFSQLIKAHGWLCGLICRSRSTSARSLRMSSRWLVLNAMR